MNIRLPIVLLLSAALLAGCKDREAEAAAQAAAQAAADEQAATEAARAFEAAVADGNWALAKAQGDLLFAKWPTTDAAERVRAQYEDAKAKGEGGYPIKDFYLTNSICRASPTMQRCSAELLHSDELLEAAE